MNDKPIEVLFPSNPKNKIKYYDVHYKYLLNILLEVSKNNLNNMTVETKELSQLEGNCFEMYINNVQVVIDFFDHLSVYKKLKEVSVCFKYHYSREHHRKYGNLFPLGPISFHNWDNYGQLHKNIIYSCNNDIVLNNQRPGGNAFERRKKVQELLRTTYGSSIDTRWYKNQNDFWYLINNCLVSVCVPGARNDMLDRGHFQYMALGCCTISPKLDNVLAFSKEVKPNIHYVECKADYSDLIDKIEWCKEDRDRCKKIGYNAKKLFRRTSTPYRIWKWMISNTIKL